MDTRIEVRRDRLAAYERIPDEVLDDLIETEVYALSYTKSDTHHTAMLEGRKSLVFDIKARRDLARDRERFDAMFAPLSQEDGSHG